jgi:glycosyltransferase involved in cell wall biosynthesis
MKHQNICFELPNEHDLKISGIDYPHVTVVITSYNYSQYIVKCMESIERQDYPKYDCIIVDDCSTDQSVDIIKRYISNRDLKTKYRLITHKKNLGQMAAFKTGLEASEGVFIVFIDADDIIFKNFISTHIKFHLTSEFPVAFTCSDQVQINERDEMFYCHHPDLQHFGKIRYVENQIGVAPWTWVWATTSSMMYRKAVVEMITPYDTDKLRICADNYIAKFSNLLSGSLLIPSALGCYRRHGNNNFSKNPFIGGILPTGDMKTHPTDALIKHMILSHFANNRDKFMALLSEPRFIRILWTLVNHIHEINSLFKKYPLLFNDRPYLYRLKLKINIFISKAIQIILTNIKRLFKKPIHFLKSLIL